MQSYQKRESAVVNDSKKKFSKKSIRRDFKINKLLYLMAAPVIAYFIIFHYIPIWGLVISFQDYVPMKGIWGSEWIGIKNFIDFFNSYYFWRLIKNTLTINIANLIFGFPAPIVFALLLNELKNGLFKRSIQTISYIPHFVSIMVVCGILINFTASEGLFNDIIQFFGGDRSNLLRQPEMFVPIYVGSEIWQRIGYSSIIYLAAISSINPELYEAAYMDGANRLKQAVHITLPGIMSTIIVLLLLRMGKMLSVGFEKIILLYNPSIYKTADVISSFVYRKGLLDTDYSYATAVSFFNSFMNLLLLMIANTLSRRLSETSLW